MPFCIKCGLHNQEEALFCSGCGSAMRQASAQNGEPSATPSQAPTAVQQSGRRQARPRTATTEGARDQRLRALRFLVWTLVGAVVLFAVVFLRLALPPLWTPKRGLGICRPRPPMSLQGQSTLPAPIASRREVQRRSSLPHHPARRRRFQHRHKLPLQQQLPHRDPSPPVFPPTKRSKSNTTMTTKWLCPSTCKMLKQ